MKQRAHEKFSTKQQSPRNINEKITKKKKKQNASKT